MHLRRLALAALLACALAAAPAAARASTLVDRNPQGPVRLQVDRNGVALITYRTRGRMHHVLAWGALNMSRGRLRLDFSGGWGSGVADWRRFRNVCGPYRGERFEGIQLALVLCTAPDGTHWALQRWRRIAPNYGGTTGSQELRVSHWSGPVADLEIYTDWSRYGPARGVRWPHLFGTYSWQGIPIAVGKATPQGVPLDDKGRNMYLDSLNPDYGYPAGGHLWRRVNGFLAARPSGQFCFEIGPKVPITRLAGISSVNRYRMSAVGPGATPDVRVAFDGPPSPYDPYWQLAMNEVQRQLIGNPAAHCGSPREPVFFD